MVTTLYWLLFGAAVVYLYYLVACERARRARIRRMRDQRLRRRYREQHHPARWQ